MEDMGASLGATAVALFVVKEVMSYLKLTATKNGKNGNKYHEYERWKAMEEALKSNTNATKNTCTVLANLVQITRDVKDEVKELRREIRK